MRLRFALVWLRTYSSSMVNNIRFPIFLRDIRSLRWQVADSSYRQGSLSCLRFTIHAPESFEQTHNCFRCEIAGCLMFCSAPHSWLRTIRMHRLRHTRPLRVQSLPLAVMASASLQSFRVGCEICCHSYQHACNREFEIRHVGKRDECLSWLGLTLRSIGYFSWTTKKMAFLLIVCWCYWESPWCIHEKERPWCCTWFLTVFCTLKAKEVSSSCNVELVLWLLDLKFHHRCIWDTHAPCTNRSCLSPKLPIFTKRQ